MTAAEVAERVGFNNLQSFYYNFKKAVGKTPTEYLRNAKEKSH
ncbi:MAG: helix-turn-helix domain-containing protein [Clostridia bacterium]|nr:helix-turn-helix domain-containing protein [Clostridia bacterium]